MTSNRVSYVVVVCHIFTIVILDNKLWVNLTRKNEYFVYIFWNILPASFLIELKASLTYIVFQTDTFESHNIRIHLFVPDSAHAFILLMLSLAFPFFQQRSRFVRLYTTIRQNSSVEHIRMRIDGPFEKILPCSFSIKYISKNETIRIYLNFILFMHFHIFYFLRLFLTLWIALENL